MPTFAAPSVRATPRDDGSIHLASPMPLGAHARCVGDVLAAWAARAPERPFLAERTANGPRHVTYAETHDAVRALGQALLDRGLGPTRPLLLLSDNGIEHALLQLAAMHVGVPAAPVSPAYSLQSRDFAKLRAIAAQLGAGAVYVDAAAPFAAALDALGVPPTSLLVRDEAGAPPGASTVRALTATVATDAVARAFAGVGPDTVAKVLFTSGSTGAPKGVVNTQRMLCANQQQIAQLWPFLSERPPVVVDWLPWSHTFGGNHNFNMVLWHGGTLHVDAGKPAPGRMGPTLDALRAVSPTLYFNVPRGFDMLVAHLEADDALASRFFAELDLLFYAAAALPPVVWQRLEKVSARARGTKVAMVSAWGSTETAPLVTSVHFPIDRAGVIGLPAPGCELRLVPHGDRLEMRVRGPNVTPGYWMRGGGVEPAPFDDEGFLPTGDAGRFDDPRDPSRGVVFDGRIAENFKLTSGTWVAVSEVRLAVVDACAPLVQDAVVAGHDRDALALLVFPSPALLALSEDERTTALAARLAAYNRACPSAGRRVLRALVLDEPPSIDGGEITDKGYVNQRAVLTRRAAAVDALYAPVPSAGVIVVPDA